MRIQVKSAWLSESRGNYIVDARRCQTNRRSMKHSKYDKEDFEFAVVCIEDLSVFYVFPVDVFLSYAGPIDLVETDKRQRKPRSAGYREAWQLILEWAHQKETSG